MSSWKNKFIEKEISYVCRICGHREEPDAPPLAWKRMLVHVGQQHPEYRMVNRPKTELSGAKVYPI